MRILYIHQYFKTPSEPGGTRSYWIAKELLQQGHQVTMITSSNMISEKTQRLTTEGIDIIYIKEDYSQSMGVWRRMGAFLSFMYKSTRFALKQKEVDLVIATSTPLTVGIPALIMKWIRKVPFVFEVRDLWPEVPIQMGALKNPVLKGIAIQLEKTIYKNAVHIVALSPGMQEGVRRYVPSSKVSMIPNMSKKDEFWPRIKNTSLAESIGLGSTSFKIIHFGSLGLANGAQSIIESAKLIKHDSTIEFVFVGGGAMESMLRKECEENALKNVKFLGKYSMDTTSEIVNLCDVSIVSFQDIPILYTNSPNKLFDSLSAGKPIIVNSKGWTKSLVEEINCGYYVNPRQPKELIEKIRYLQGNPTIVDEMGRNSRELAVSKFDKTILCNQFVEVIERLNV